MSNSRLIFKRKKILQVLENFAMHAIAQHTLNDIKILLKHCQRQAGPVGWVLFTSNFFRSYHKFLNTNDQISSSESRPSITVSTKLKLQMQLCWKDETANISWGLRMFLEHLRTSKTSIEHLRTSKASMIWNIWKHLKSSWEQLRTHHS